MRPEHRADVDDFVRELCELTRQLIAWKLSSPGQLATFTDALTAASVARVSGASWCDLCDDWHHEGEGHTP